MQNSSGSGIYCREELLSLGARASRPHKTWQGRGDWLHRVGRFTRRLTLEQRLDKYAGGTPALPGGNPWLARCRSLSRALFCRSILPPSHARLRILQKAQRKKSFFATKWRRLWPSNSSGLVSHCVGIGSPPKIWLTPWIRVSYQILRTDATYLWVESRGGAPALDRGSRCCRRLSPLAGASISFLAAFPRPRSSNRTCCFPASGFQSGSCLRPRKALGP